MMGGKGEKQRKNGKNRVFDVFLPFFWWEEVDSNYRSRRRQIYSLIHLATLESSRWAEYTIYSVVHVFYLLNTWCKVLWEKTIRELLENFYYFSVCIMVDTVFRASVFNRLSL